METGLLFPKLVNKELRKHLKASLLSVRCLIPSIKSMHENLKYLKVGSDLLKRLLVGEYVSKGTLRCTLYAEWEERGKKKKKIPRDVLIEKSSGAQVIKDVSVDTCWDLTYKQLWIFVLRNFADLGGRAPLKEVGASLYPQWEDPNVRLRFGRFALGVGVKPEGTLSIETDPREQDIRAFVSRRWSGVKPGELDDVVSDLMGRLPNDDVQPKPSPYKEKLSKKDIDNLERRWGVPFTRAYNRGKDEFYLPHTLSCQAEDSVNMPSTTFIQKDFVNVFFGPTVDIWDRLCDLPDEGKKPGQNSDVLVSGPPAEYDASWLEEPLDTDSSSPLTSVSEPPTPVLDDAQYESLSEFGIQDATSAPSSLAGSPELSPVASISSVSFRDETSTPDAPFEAVAGSSTAEPDQSIAGPLTT
jgi:hypothetical protein